MAEQRKDLLSIEEAEVVARKNTHRDRDGDGGITFVGGVALSHLLAPQPIDERTPDKESQLKNATQQALERFKCIAPDEDTATRWVVTGTEQVRTTWWGSREQVIGYPGWPVAVRQKVYDDNPSTFYNETFVYYLLQNGWIVEECFRRRAQGGVNHADIITNAFDPAIIARQDQDFVNEIVAGINALGVPGRDEPPPPPTGRHNLI